MKYDLFIFCGEPSGDLHGEALIQNLLKLSPKLKLFGVGGPKMRQLPFKSVLDMEKFQVMGFIDVLVALPRIGYFFYVLANLILKTKPKAVLFIDYPGFSLRMEKHLKKKGFSGKIIHYICPSVWGHGKGRIALMEKNLDLLLTILPFEKKLFSPSLQTHYVGHPLTSRILENTCSAFPWAEGKMVVGVFPGSRKKEIICNLPLQLTSLKNTLPQNATIAVSVSQNAFIPLITECIKNSGLAMGPQVRLIPHKHSYSLMKSCSFAVATSGTVTLELALQNVPTVVTYGIPPVDLFIAKNILRINLPFYCIANIILQKEVFKELIGPPFTEGALSEEIQKLLSPLYQEEKKALCKEVLENLGRKKASLEAAHLTIEAL